MKKTKREIAFILMWLLSVSTSIAHGQAPVNRNSSDRSEVELTNLFARANRTKRPAFSLMPSSRAVNVSGHLFSITPMAGGPNLTVVGGGTLGRLTKWTGFTSSNSFVGDTTIFEDKFGKVGIGTDSPASRLTVAGMIETTLGGLKFPDGTVQTTSAAGSLFAVAHDGTLKGNGTQASPLGVAVPILIVASTDFGLVDVTNLKDGGVGVLGFGGKGVVAFGAAGQTNPSIGVVASGGQSSSGVGGMGVNASGADSTSHAGGDGIQAFGGDSQSLFGGAGVTGVGGNSGSEDGGIGVDAIGGRGSGIGKSGGYGILASGGPGVNGATNGLAGKFQGDVEITGKLKVISGIKMFHIDHPLDPENKYLNHAAIESSEVLNIYSGNVRLDDNGEAVVKLPDWFQALNDDFRYSLTPIGAPGAGLFIAQEIERGRFVIAGGAPRMKVSWQVTGVRSDPTTRKYKFEIEEEKSERERGYYLNPDAYGQPEERNIEWARNHERMQQLKERRIDSKQMRKREKAIER